MDAELVKRLKGWLFLRLEPEDWREFGSSAASVLGSFDNDPDQENALLRFVEVVILLEMQRQKNPRLAFSVAKQRHLELKRLGLTKEQVAKVAGTACLVADGYLELVRDAKGERSLSGDRKGPSTPKKSIGIKVLDRNSPGKSTNKQFRTRN